MPEAKSLDNTSEVWHSNTGIRKHSQPTILLSKFGPVKKREGLKWKKGRVQKLYLLLRARLPPAFFWSGSVFTYLLDLVLTRFQKNILASGRRVSIASKAPILQANPCWVPYGPSKFTRRDLWTPPGKTQNKITILARWCGLSKILAFPNNWGHLGYLSYLRYLRALDLKLWAFTLPS